MLFSLQDRRTKDFTDQPDEHWLTETSCEPNFSSAQSSKTKDDRECAFMCDQDGLRGRARSSERALIHKGERRNTTTWTVVKKKCRDSRGWRVECVGARREAKIKQFTMLKIMDMMMVFVWPMLCAALPNVLTQHNILKEEKTSFSSHMKVIFLSLAPHGGWKTGELSIERCVVFHWRIRRWWLFVNKAHTRIHVLWYRTCIHVRFWWARQWKR